MKACNKNTVANTTTFNSFFYLCIKETNVKAYETTLFPFLGHPDDRFDGPCCHRLCRLSGLLQTQARLCTES